MSIRDIKQKHNLLVNNIPGVIYALDKHGYFTFVSDSVQEVLGYGTDELIGRHFSYVIHPNDIQSVSREFLLPRFNGITTGSDRSPKLFDERRSFPRITNKLKVRLRSKSCKEKSGEQVLFCTVNSSGQYSTKTNGKKVFCGTAGIIFDVNAEKISLSLLEHSKYSVLDLFTQALSHTYCNIFTGIYGHLQLIEMQLEESSSFSPNIEAIKNGIENAISFIKQLALTVSETQKGRGSHNLEVVIRETACEIFSDSQVQISCEINDSLFRLDVDPDYIHHIFRSIFYHVKRCILPDSIIQASIYPCKEIKSFPRMDCKYLTVEIEFQLSEILISEVDTVSNECRESLDKISSLALSYSLLKKAGGLLELRKEEKQGIMELCLPVIISD